MSTGVNQRRAIVVSRSRRNPQAIRELKAKITAAVLRDYSGKQIAGEAGTSHCSACCWARTLGFRLMYVTDEERAHLMARRAVEATERRAA